MERLDCFNTRKISSVTKVYFLHHSLLPLTLRRDSAISTTGINQHRIGKMLGARAQVRRDRASERVC
jgi:hypothetical protein